MKPGRFGGTAPLTGIVFVVLVIIGGPLLAGNTPGPNASGARVIAFYEAHRSRERISAVVLTLAFIVFVFFAGSLRGYLRRQKPAEALSAVLLGGAVLLAAGQTTVSGLGFALSDAPARLAPASAQTLNLLSNDMVLTSSAGFSVFGIASGLAILRAGLLPKWLGWLALAIGIVILTPAEFAAFIAFALWTVVVSISMTRRGSGQPKP